MEVVMQFQTHTLAVLAFLVCHWRMASAKIAWRPQSSYRGHRGLHLRPLLPDGAAPARAGPSDRRRRLLEVSLYGMPDVQNRRAR